MFAICFFNCCKLYCNTVLKNSSNLVLSMTKDFQLYMSILLDKLHKDLIFMVQGLTVREMEELRDDVKMHLDLDRATPTHVEYWEVSSFFHCLVTLLFFTKYLITLLPCLVNDIIILLYSLQIILAVTIILSLISS